MKQMGTKDLIYEQRLRLSEFLKVNTSKKIIARCLNCSLATVYNEIKRGTVNESYDAEYSQNKYEQLKKVRGKQEVLLLDSSLAKIIADLILNENLSPEKVIKRLNEQNIDCPTKTTIYVAIDKGLIPGVSRENLRNKTTSMFSNGLIQIPIWIRNELELKDGDLLTISLDNNNIILGKLLK